MVRWVVLVVVWSCGRAVSSASAREPDDPRRTRGHERRGIRHRAGRDIRARRIDHGVGLGVVDRDEVARAVVGDAHDALEPGRRRHDRHAGVGEHVVDERTERGPLEAGRQVPGRSVAERVAGDRGHAGRGAVDVVLDGCRALEHDLVGPDRAGRAARDGDPRRPRAAAGTPRSTARARRAARPGTARPAPRRTRRRCPRSTTRRACRRPRRSRAGSPPTPRRAGTATARTPAGTPTGRRPGARSRPSRRASTARRRTPRAARGATGRPTGATRAPAPRTTRCSRPRRRMPRRGCRAAPTGRPPGRRARRPRATPATVPGVRQHRGVELLGAEPARPQLEEHDRVGAAREVRQAVARELARALGDVARLPVHAPTSSAP